MYDLLITIISLDTFFWFKGWIVDLRAQWQRCSRIEGAPQNHFSKPGHRLPGAWCWRCSEMSSASCGDRQRRPPVYCPCLLLWLLFLSLWIGCWKGGEEVREENYLIVWCFLWGLTKGVRVGEAGMDFSSPSFLSCLWTGSTGVPGLHFWCCALNMGTWLLILCISLSLKQPAWVLVLPLPLRGG